MSRGEVIECKLQSAMRNDFPTPKPTAVGFLKLRGMGAKIEGSIPRGLTSPKMVIQKNCGFRSPNEVAVVQLTHGLTITGGNDQR
jgi:hypothetical protein